MDTTQDIAGPRFATRLAFFAAGFTMACWAPLIPFAKRNVGVGDGELGLLLLCLGVGSLVAMPATGWVSARFGTRPVIIGGGLVLAVLLPGLILASSPALLAAALFAFGAALGTLDVAMNVHAVEVEKLDGRPLMSGFHAMFSVGGLAGASGMTALLASGLSPSASTVAASALTGAAILLAVPRLLRVRAGEPVPFVLPHGVVLVIAALVAITFLVEAAMLDWGALLMIGRGLSDVDSAGLGFVLFSVAMVARPSCRRPHGGIFRELQNARLGWGRDRGRGRRHRDGRLDDGGTGRLRAGRARRFQYRAGAFQPCRTTDGHAGRSGGRFGDDGRLCGDPRAVRRPSASPRT